MHTLFGFPGSGSAAVELALHRCALPFELVNAASWAPESAREQLAAANPLQQIPTLRLPGGAVMTESAAILIQLGLEHPGSGLLPGTPAERAQTVRGLVYIAANCYSAISITDYPERWLDGFKDGEAPLRRGSRSQLHHHWTLFADQFMPLAATQPFLGGAQPGALDFLAVVVSRWSGTRRAMHQHRPAFSELLQRIEADPLVAEIFQLHFPKPAPLHD
ncbi:glutathione S-transferase family protein [Ideonella azotifigens]|uniref:Glutathione S-transferase n=1 Tax=Ideonella azotifigens TaxID=513160 RepID=A0ABP3V7G3_9BURK|nr:glutathione S-transferase family protein [Ideonella azotifigens]MCD2345019.1 glutathione S-transferase family protein [Ideonella azotifigens]